VEEKRVMGDYDTKERTDHISADKITTVMQQNLRKKNKNGLVKAKKKYLNTRNHTQGTRVETTS